MYSMILFISGSEIFIILLFILIFFGSDKIPDFMRMMGRGVREFRKATDDIKREFNDNTSGVMNDIRSIQNSLTDTLTKEISDPVQATVDDTAKTFDEYQQYHDDYYYSNPDEIASGGNEYRDEMLSETTVSGSNDTVNPAKPAEETQPPKPAET